MELPAEGGCLCGEVRYRLLRPPLLVYACHCTRCRRLTGTAFAMATIMETVALEQVSGEPKLLAKDWPDGTQWCIRFCDRCGGQLWSEPPYAPDVRVLRPGTLDEHSGLIPDAHQWLSSALPWLQIPAGARSFDEQLTNEQIIELIQARQARGDEA